MALSPRLDGCPVCDSTQRSVVALENQLQVVRCGHCGHAYVWPVPSAAALSAIYAGEYYLGAHGSLGFRDYGGLAAARRRMFSRHLDRIERLRPAGRVLDVGCATGDFLMSARARGWDPIGVDPSPAAAQARAAGLPIRGKTIQDADLRPRSVDLVTFWDVLEHLPDPVADLRRAGSLLGPGGMVALTVPDAGGAVARLSGRRWFGYKTAGEHLHFFTGSTLSRALRAAGFDLVQRRPVAWSCSLGFLGDRAGLYLGLPGRLLNQALQTSLLAGVVVDVPMVNQFVLARPTAGPGLDLRRSA